MDLVHLGKKVAGRTIKTKAGCLEWQGAKNATGYGMMRANGRTIGVHRIALAAALGDASMLDPTETTGFHNRYVLHSCDNPACCNPAHLRIGNGQDNADDKVARGRGRPNPPRKFTEEQVREIRREAVTWDGLCDMMKKYCVGQNAIENIVREKFYRHVK